MASSTKEESPSIPDDERRRHRDGVGPSHRLPLPSPDQIWSHGTCTTTSLSEALDDRTITAIETDLLLGYRCASSTATTSSGGKRGEGVVEGNDDDGPAPREEATKTRPRPVLIPIAAHPPDRESDLPFRTFWETSTTVAPGGDGSEAKRSSRILRKHLKLDFKELEAVTPCLDVINETSIVDRNGKTIYLNADVLPGPGCRNDDLHLDGDSFVELCVKGGGGATGVGQAGESSDDRRRLGYAFSLGFRVDCRSVFGYTEDDVEEMKRFILRHKLLDISEGVVLALNARVLSKHLEAFDEFLDEFPTVQVLIWTATGEPPTSQTKIDEIRSHYAIRGVVDRIGFDCQVAPTYVSGLFYDTAVRTVSVYWNAEKFIRECIKGGREGKTKRKVA